MSLMLESPAALPRLWDRFQAGKFSRDEIERSGVLQRWQRCRTAGLPADGAGEPVMSLEGLADALDRFAPLLAPGAPFDAFSTEMARAGFCGLFCDADGRILAERISEPFRITSARTRLIPGAVWSEATRGTNGVGTALFERKPVSIVGAEHYERRNQVLACFAAPIRDIRNRVVAVLDASGPVSSASPFIQASVTATAAALEALLVARTYDAAVPGGLFEIERLLSNLPHATLLVEATGHVRRANQRYRGMLPAVQSPEIARMVREHFAAPRARRGAIELAEHLNGHRIELEPLGNESDPFAALVHVLPRANAVRPVVRPATTSAAFVNVRGSDPAVVHARARGERFAKSELPVLVLGESGTGKEAFARAVHAAGRRPGGPFVVVHCDGPNGALVEASLFGHAPRSISEASPSGGSGSLAAASSGTIFLEEVHALSASAQGKLLQFLEEGRWTRYGEHQERSGNARVIASSTHDLAALAADGRFRNDLYYRIRGAVVRLPALRDRSDRIELARELLDSIAGKKSSPKPLGFSRAATEWIEQQPWPGNVRELRIAIEHALVLAGDAPRIERAHLPVEEAAEARPSTALRTTAERAAVRRAMEIARGNLSDAARSLGVARSTLYRMLARHGLRPEAEPPDR